VVKKGFEALGKNKGRKKKKKKKGSLMGGRERENKTEKRRGGAPAEGRGHRSLPRKERREYSRKKGRKDYKLEEKKEGKTQSCMNLGKGEKPAGGKKKLEGTGEGIDRGKSLSCKRKKKKPNIFREKGIRFAIQGG